MKKFYDRNYFFKIFCAIIILIRMARFLTYDS